MNISISGIYSHLQVVFTDIFQLAGWRGEHQEVCAEQLHSRKKQTMLRKHIAAYLFPPKYSKEAHLIPRRRRRKQEKGKNNPPELLAKISIITTILDHSLVDYHAIIA